MEMSEGFTHCLLGRFEHHFIQVQRLLDIKHYEVSAPLP